MSGRWGGLYMNPDHDGGNSRCTPPTWLEPVNPPGILPSIHTSTPHTPCAERVEYRGHSLSSISGMPSLAMQCMPLHVSGSINPLLAGRCSQSRAYLSSAPLQPIMKYKKKRLYEMYVE